jgi:two-component system sensor histidine kinase AlgZ
MAAAPEQSGQGDGTRRTGEFFIPDVCAPRPVFVTVLLTELLVLIYTLASSNLPRFEWNLLATSSLFVQWIVLLCAAMVCLARAYFARLSLALTTLFCLLLIMLVTAASSYAARIALPGLAPAGPAEWWVLRNVLISLVLGGVVLRYFYLQQQITLRERAELQARLDSLRARIRPHFLFNTMNTIASLIDSRPRDAERAVEDLAELFRASLQEQDLATTVGDELRLCEVYLGIEKLRLGERLQVDWQVDAAARDSAMPALLLQPLVENAVYHGIARLPAGGTITVQVACKGSQLEVTVLNPMPAVSSPTDGHHMALANIAQRLQALYGSDGVLETEAGTDQYRVRLAYPREGGL